MTQLIMKRKILSIVEEVKRIRQNTTMDEEQLDLYLQEQDGLTVNGTRLVKAILFEQETNNKRVIMYMRQVISHLNVITCEHFACKSDFDNTLGMSKMINAEIVIKNKADTIGIIGVRSKGATFDIEILEKEGAHDEWKFNELKDKRKWLKESRMC